MRLWSGLALACVAVAGCGEAENAQQPRQEGGRELTVTLAPTQSSAPAEIPPAPEAGFETIAAAEPPAPVAKAPLKEPAPQRDAEPVQVEVAVAPAEPPAAAVEGSASAAVSPAEPTPDGPPAAAVPTGTGAWAGYLRKVGFPCSRVASTSRVERAAGPGLQFYRVDCEGGATYQATNKRGHLYFRRWRG
jgi:hypothetical protein